MSSSLAVSSLFRRVAIRQPQKRTFGSHEDLVKTALNAMHKELGGDMVPFAGYELPVLFKGENGGVMKEHLWCRAEGKAALFDVSHMGQVCFVLSELHGMNSLIVFQDIYIFMIYIYLNIYIELCNYPCAGSFCGLKLS